jgi:NodT family efflux transporter outer membrane factor (OMF) lipoprotein
MRFYRITSAALLPLILSGCADFKGMPSLDMKLPEKFEQQHAERIAETPTTLEKNWWMHTDDKTLIAIIHAVEKLNLSLEQAQLRLNAARIDTGGYDYLPSLTATASGQFDKLVRGDTPVGGINNVSGGKKIKGYYNAKLDASWEIPLYGQLGDAADITNANVAFAQADVDTVRASVINEAVRLYAEMRSKQQEVLKREAIVAASQKITDYEKIKHMAGLLTDSELGTSQQSLLAAQDALKRAENEKVSRMQQLATLLGAVTPDDTWKTPADIPIFEVPAFDDTPLDVLRNRPDIRKAEASVLAAAGEYYLSKSEMYPKISLSGSLSQLGNLTGNPLPGETVQLSGIPSISLPLFDWGKRLASVQVKDERLSEKASAYRETVIGAMNEVEEFWSSYRTAQAQEKSAQENMQIAIKASAHASLLFTQGINDGIGEQTAIIDAQTAVINELQAKANSITQLTALTKALGIVSNPTTNEKKDD